MLFIEKELNHSKTTNKLHQMFSCIKPKTKISKHSRYHKQRAYDTFIMTIEAIMLALKTLS